MKEMCFVQFKKDKEAIQDTIQVTSREMKQALDESPKKAQAFVQNKKKEMVQGIKSQARKHMKEIQLNKVQEYQEKLGMKTKIEREKEEASQLIERARSQKVNDVSRKKESDI